MKLQFLIGDSSTSGGVTSDVQNLSTVSQKSIDQAEKLYGHLDLKANMIVATAGNNLTWEWTYQKGYDVGMVMMWAKERNDHPDAVAFILPGNDPVQEERYFRYVHMPLTSKLTKERPLVLISTSRRDLDRACANTDLRDGQNRPGHPTRLLANFAASVTIISAYMLLKVWGINHVK